VIIKEEAKNHPQNLLKIAKNAKKAAQLNY